MVTLPLYQKPQFWAWSNNLKGVLPNTVQRRRHLERRELDRSASPEQRNAREGPAAVVGPSLNYPLLLESAHVRLHH